MAYDIQFAKNSRHMTPWSYGLTSFGDFFTDRQIVALYTLSNLVLEIRPRIVEDALIAGFDVDNRGLDSEVARAYAD